MIRHKPLDQVTMADVDGMVANSEAEGRYLEFKLTVPDNTADDKKEFLRDIASLANAGGGDVVFGIEEDKGTAKAVIGLPEFDEDNGILRLENMIRAGITPQILVHSRLVVDAGDRPSVLIIRVPQSWTAPHMVQTTPQFYSRSTKGKYPLDITELRTKFESASDLPRRIENWRDARIARIVANEGPVPLASSDRIVIHLVPLESMATEWQYDAADLKQLSLFGSSYSEDERCNLDGVVGFTASDGPTRAYTQAFRSGRVEAVASGLLQFDQDSDCNMWIPMWYEAETIKLTKRLLDRLQKIGVAMPMIFLMSLVGVKGAAMRANTLSTIYHRRTPVDRDCLLLPDIMIESYDCEVSYELRPVFDAVWNACGCERSLNYNEDGEWAPGQ